MRTFLAAAATALAMTFALAPPAAAFDPAAMSDTERSAFRAEVRAYLLENPEVLMEAIEVLDERHQAQQAQEDLSILRQNAAALNADPDSWVGGNPEGDITVVEFVDYRCGYCRRAFEEVKELVESDGNIRLVMKEYPILGEDSVASSRFAVAVLQLEGGEAYEAVHEALLSLRGSPEHEALAAIADDLGLNAAALLAHMESADVERVIATNRALGQRLAINGTPTFVIHETMVRGYVPLDGMRQIVAGQRGKM